MKIVTIIAAIILGGSFAQVSYGQAELHPASPLQFDVVSVKMHAPDNQGSRMQLLPDGFRLTDVLLQDFIVQSWDLVLNDQIVGLPNWANSVRFDIEAKVAGNDIAAFRKLPLEQVRSMAQPILADRFKFASHLDKKVLSLYELVVAKDGSKLKPTTMSDEDINARTGVIGMGHASNENGRTNQLTATGVTMGRLADALSQQGLGRVVLDHTNLSGRYDFRLTWAPQTTAADATADISGPSMFTAVSEQLGLKLEPGKGPVPVLVIDHIEMPSPN